MGLFFNGAENWGLAFGTWPAVTTSSSLSFTSRSVTASQTVNSKCQCARTWIVWRPFHPSCPVRWTGMDVRVYWGGSCTAPASCPLLADPSPPLPRLPLCLPALTLLPAGLAGSQSRDSQAQAQIAHGHVLQSCRCEWEGAKMGRWAGWRGPLLPMTLPSRAASTFPTQQLVQLVQTRETTPDRQLLRCLLVTASKQ